MTSKFRYSGKDKAFGKRMGFDGGGSVPITGTIDIGSSGSAQGTSFGGNAPSAGTFQSPGASTPATQSQPAQPTPPPTSSSPPKGARPKINENVGVYNANTAPYWSFQTDSTGFAGTKPNTGIA